MSLADVSPRLLVALGLALSCVTFAVCWWGMWMVRRGVKPEEVLLGWLERLWRKRER